MCISYIDIRKGDSEGPFSCSERRLRCTATIQPHDFSNPGSIALNKLESVKHSREVWISGLRDSHKDCLHGQSPNQTAK